MDEKFEIYIDGLIVQNGEEPQTIVGEYRYTDEHPYISTGLSRETEKGKKYTGFKGDVAEFNDHYMKDFHYSPNAVNKMGLGIDEVVTSTINFSRKNYADYFPTKPFPEDVKLVGNTIKSKKMPDYIAKFLSVGIRLLLNGKGQEFIDEYYKYQAKIYNHEIPLRDIASKGKIKKSLDQYQKDLKVLTKAGNEKPRQAWYELAIRENLHVDNGDTIYFINTGTKKTESDCQKIVHYFYYENGEKVEFTKKINSQITKYKKTLSQQEKDIFDKKAWLNKNYPGYFTENEIVLKCIPLPREIIESEEDVICTEENGYDYNVSKYIDMFNKRIKPLLVCFSKEIRKSILVDDPEKRQYFTAEQCKLTHGEPNKESDQDTYEQLMTMEDKEISFWIRYDLIPPFIEECKMGKWEDIKNDYLKRKEEEEKNGISKLRIEYENALASLTKTDIEAFIEDGKIPSVLSKLIEVENSEDDDNIGLTFISKKNNNVVLGNIYDILDLCNSIISEEESYEE